jgi:hypothetical protein
MADHVFVVRELQAASSCESSCASEALGSTIVDLRRSLGMRTASQKSEFRWRVEILTGAQRRFIDFAIASDADTAIAQVVKAHQISDAMRKYLVAVREELGVATWGSLEKGLDYAPNSIKTKH